jgi:hypothetical protein
VPAIGAGCPFVTAGRENLQRLQQPESVVVLTNFYPGGGWLSIIQMSDRHQNL